MHNRHVKPGLRVLVTAGASGIGRAIADAFVEDGARVHVCDVNEAALADCAASTGVTTSVVDVSDEPAVARMVDDAVVALGGLDVLINNAGIAGPTGTVDEIASDAWRRTIDINLNGQFYCAHYAVPHLRAAGRGRSSICPPPPGASAMPTARPIPLRNGRSSALRKASPRNSAPTVSASTPSCPAS
jgi:NAD(P)-dependent dehydrogenase (short-subunit alcohol dehydrogenase family)